MICKENKNVINWNQIPIDTQKNQIKKNSKKKIPKIKFSLKKKKKKHKKTQKKLLIIFVSDIKDKKRTIANSKTLQKNNSIMTQIPKGSHNDLII